MGAQQRAMCPIITAMLALVGTACGDGVTSRLVEKSPEQIITAAADSLASVKSVRYVSQAVVEGQRVEVDFVVTRGRSKGSVTMGGINFEVVMAGDRKYARGRAFFRMLELPDQAVDNVIGKRWGLLPSSGTRVDLLDPVSRVSTLARCFRSAHDAQRMILRKGSEAEVDGEKAVVLDDVGGVPGTFPARLYVAASGPPYPLRIEQTGAPTPGKQAQACGGVFLSESTHGARDEYRHYDRAGAVAEPALAVDLRPGSRTFLQEVDPTR